MSPVGWLPRNRDQPNARNRVWDYFTLDARYIVIRIVLKVCGLVSMVEISRDVLHWRRRDQTQLEHHELKFIVHDLVTLHWPKVHYAIALISDRHYVQVFAITNPSVVCNVGAHYSEVQNFLQYFFTILYLSHPLTSVQNLTEIVPGEPLCRGR